MVGKLPIARRDGVVGVFRRDHSRIRLFVRFVAGDMLRIMQESIWQRR